VRSAKIAQPIEWQICNTDAEWQAHQQDLQTTTVLEPDRTLWSAWVARNWRTATLLLIGLAIIGGWIWNDAQRGMAPIEADLHASIESDARTTAMQDDSERPNHVITAQDGTTWPLSDAVQSFKLLRDTAIVQLVTEPTADEPVLRQTRFYRHTTEGWLLTHPDAEVWGAPHHLESAHFIFNFRQNDAEVVAAVAPQIDDVYSALQHNFGLTPSLEKQVIEVSIRRITGTMPYPRLLRGHLVVPSPAIYAAPVELSDREILVQSIALPLIDDVIEQAVEVHNIPQHWQPLLRGLRLWQWWELDVPLASWQQEVVQWFYIDLPKATAEQQSVLPDNYRELCTMHRLWMQSPVVVGIPLKCTTFDTATWSSRRWAAHVPQMSLEQLQMPLADWQTQALEELDLPYSPNEALALSTLIEYAVSAYGYEQLPVLLASLPRYNDWETLAPAVFGVSAFDFEASWRSYLAQHYHVSLDR
jgi:hypothetical protein